MANETKQDSDCLYKGVLLKADAVGETFQSEIRSSLSKCSKPLKLVGILSTNSAPSKQYATFTRKQCEALGFEFKLITVGAGQSDEYSQGEGVEEAIIEANEDESVNGIMVGLSVSDKHHAK